jgi:glutathione S-transferase
VSRLAIAILVALPVVVSATGLGVVKTAAVTVLTIVAIWVDRLRKLAQKPATPPITLETISVSHFSEKVRWCLDRLGVDYREDRSCGTLRAFYLGRTVPRLRIHSGGMASDIASSPDILRYLWGRHAHEPRAAFLKPDPKRLALEASLDRAGRMLQIWAYYHILDDAEQTARLWGVADPLVPAWQRAIVRPLLPLQRFLIRRAFGISRERYQRACEYIENLWGDIETRLADGRRSITGPELNYTDLTFAAMTGLWLQPDGYGGANGVNVRMTRVPEAMANDIARWTEDFPKAVAYTESLYAQRYDTPEGS